eukprot:CAMPEP_0184383714 /NCGR_PEP_ID=MMETSP0007-20130409/7359_1 /TAXON_ID=97485 /ORGANISM="Prymnesium parvum, Strain Texoma1" /LENGTH=48 /DNA_ID= /DNA_START= /DNA_END= /DNA_ORIENTATION=
MAWRSKERPYVRAPMGEAPSALTRPAACNDRLSDVVYQPTVDVEVRVA